MSLSPEQVQIIQATVPILVEHGTTITTVFYKNMLEAHPELHTVFNTSNQVNGHQPRALAGALYAYAANIDNLGALGPAVELICNKHASLYIQPDQYKIVGKYLLEAMGQVLGEALTPDIHAAWAAAYWQLADIMIQREGELYQHAASWTDFRDFRVARKVRESAEITSFYLQPVDGKPLPAFNPGQYISVQVFVPDLKYPQARQYSLSDAPRKDYYRISVRKEDPGATACPGYVSNILHDNVQEGDSVKVSHPFGDFYNKEPENPRPVVLLAAGVGLTPLVSILNTIAETSGASERKIHFVHGARSAGARAFRDHVQALKEKFPNLQVTYFTSHPAAEEKQGEDYDHLGRLDLSRLQDKELFLDEPETEYYVCGPEGFMTAMLGALGSKGVNAERVKMELFGTGGVPA
ncbi:hypothetical protein FE257_011496 [Aspergillus nanangensis]|uniref:nitric oxide dioxygenase n=1 Tax=Aspergillus nanangensis TaxID=2582783 RepID=A0AAD4CH39_ASPNN|nr:hypothetical protein FE257_011496 [Aspergillus nanangensis]